MRRRCPPSTWLASPREHVTVALNGDGGDESFAGYPRYTTNLALAQLDRLPHRAAARAGALARRVPSGAIRARCAAGSGGSRSASALNRESRYLAQNSKFTQAERDQLYTPEYAALLGPSRAAETLLGPWRSSSAAGSA